MWYIRKIVMLGMLFTSAFFPINVLANNGGITEMTLTIQNNDIDLKYSAAIERTEISSVQVTMWQDFSESIDARLNIASIELSQKATGSVSIYNTTGYILGIGFRGNVLETELLNIGVSLGLDYLATEGETSSNESVSVSWFESTVKTDLELFPNKSLSFLTGASYTVIDGEHDVADTSTITSFSEQDAEGYYAGLSLKASGGGKVALIWQGGYRKGVYLSFSNQF